LCWKHRKVRVEAGDRQREQGLLLQQFLLDEFEELFRLSERQAEILNAVAVLFQRHDIGHSLFTAIIVAQDELAFDTHGGAPPERMDG
jgi:hypothetical protein